MLCTPGSSSFQAFLGAMAEHNVRIEREALSGYPDGASSLRLV